MHADADTSTITTDEAARIAGVSARTIRRWIQRGVLPATTTQDGYLIAATDLAGVQAAAGQRPRPRGHAATDADTAAATDTDTLVIVNPNAHAQLEAIRDEWLAPLVAQITSQAAQIGYLEAERDELRRRIEVAELALSTMVNKAKTTAPATAGDTTTPTGPANTPVSVWTQLLRRWRG
jgi:excisionase family DNA binding protein